jgi:aryl sulfotransferase
MSGFFWLASYPKSGNTWVRLALRSLQNNGAPVDFSDDSGWAPNAAWRHTFDEALHVESSDLTAEEAENLRPRLHEQLARVARAPMVMKVHDAWTMTAAREPLFAPALTLGAVYIVRDPRDVAVSHAAHLGQSFENTISAMANPGACAADAKNRLEPQLRQRLLTWSGHVESWLDAADIRVLTVRYEDMLARPIDTLGRIVAFLEWDASAEAVASAIEATRFEKLKQQEDLYGFRERTGRSSRFFQRGVSGGWRDLLAPELAERIQRDHGRVMARLEYR